MIKLLSVLLVFAFLFAGLPRDYDLIINSKGLAQLIKVAKVPQAMNVTVSTTTPEVSADCNSTPENS